MSKTKFIVFIGIIIASFVATFSSCQNDSTENIEHYSDESSNAFVRLLCKNMNEFLNQDLIEGVNGANFYTQTRATLETHTVPTSENIKPIYVNLKFKDTPINFKDLKTPKQIVELVGNTGAKLSLIKDESCDGMLLISDIETKQALNPLISSSKQYLYEKGFTEDEIQDMLQENDADESEIVPFVTALIKEEYAQQNFSQNTVNNSWKEIKPYFRCLVDALGVDAMSALTQSVAKNWNKAVLKRVFKIVAKKMYGPIGVMIFTIEFARCAL